MAGLAVEEEVGFEFAQKLALGQTAQEHGFVDLDIAALLLQSTPVIADGRCGDLGMPSRTSCFNPRPSLLTGDAPARYRCGSTYKFHPRPSLLTGDARRHHRHGRRCRVRRWAWRLALRTRRELGFRLNPVTVTRKQTLKAELLTDRTLRSRLETLAQETGRDEASLLADASLYLDEIIPSFNLITTYRFGKRLAGWLLRTCYRVRIGRSAEAALNRIPR